MRNTTSNATPARLLPLSAGALLLAALPAAAQFPGDIYFLDPTPVFQEGDPVVLTVATFTGTQPLGAASVELRYDAAQFQVDDIQPCLLYTSPSPRDQRGSRMPSSA